MSEYCIYGTSILADLDLFDGSASALRPGPASKDPVVLSRFASPSGFGPLLDRQRLYSAHGRELWFQLSGVASAPRVGQKCRLAVEGVVEFCFTGGESTIYYRPLSKGSPALTAFWFVHTFLPMYLAAERGYDFIHAAAVEIGGQCILFLAPTTGGKSTLGAYFLGQGHCMLADDKLTVSSRGGHFVAEPSYPYYRPFRQFEVLGLPIEHFEMEEKPIHAIYILERGSPDSAVAISEVRGLGKFEQLLPHYLFHFPFMREQRTRCVGSLVSQCPVFEVMRPWSVGRMHEVYEAICAHAREEVRCGLPD